ncbi:MAG: MgtC/SapB family protein [Fimbriimonadaceae bacterium]|nr:MgtC/SapB family protein [Fimbriimonadaceae bacterium]
MESFRGVFSSESWLFALEVMLKLGLAAVIGGAVGYERELHGRPAGIRTHILIIIGVTLFCEVGKSLGGDTGRTAANVVTGIGFLGAGTILRMGAEIKGLTSAASIWAVAAVGMAVSAGGPYYLIAILGAAMTLITLSWVDHLERRLVPHSHPKAMQVELDSQAAAMALMESLTKDNGSVKAIRIMSQEPQVIVQLDVQGPYDALLAAAIGCNGVRSAHWLD